MIADGNLKTPMPPKKTGKTLSDAEKQTLRDWIAQGAEYATHWSFRAPRAVEPAPLAGDTWSRNPIDRFLLARMESRGAEAVAPRPTGRP